MFICFLSLRVFSCHCGRAQQLTERPNSLKSRKYLQSGLLQSLPSFKQFQQIPFYFSNKVTTNQSLEDLLFPIVPICELSQACMIT